MLSIPYSGDLKLGGCTLCGRSVFLRRELYARTFAARYWVRCPEHGVIADLQTWLDFEQGFVADSDTAA